MQENTPEKSTEGWVPVYFPEGVTIGKAKLMDDKGTLLIKLNEGSEVAKLFVDNMAALSVMDISTNDAQGEK